jgi:hypothetical protein
MSKFSNDFEIKKSFTFNLEGKINPETGRSEADQLEELSELSHCTVSKKTRDYVINGMKNDSHLLSKDLKIEHFMLDGNIEPITIGIPALFDNREKFIEYYKGADQQERIKIRIALNDWSKIADNIEFNEGRKISRIAR